MAMDRGITIFFMDGSKISRSSPRQVSNEDYISLRMERMLDKALLFVEADRAVPGIPNTKLKYAQFFPAPSNLPENVIKDAKTDG